MQVSISINPTNPQELAAYLETLKAAGVPFAAATVAPIRQRKVAVNPDSLEERYKAASGKERARLSVPELEAVGWHGGPADAPEDVRRKAMLAALGEDIGEDEDGEGDAPEVGATYEPEGEIPQPGEEGVSLEDY